MTDRSRSPVEIDTELAHLASTINRAYREIDRLLDMARRAAGETPMRSPRGNRPTVWRSTPEQARERLVVRARSADPDTAWSMYNEAYILAELKRYEQIVIDTNTRVLVLEGEHDRRQWSRFFLVTSSHGHIHASRNCSTCRPTTEYGWLPNLSGATEAETVAEHGPMLCSICFPTAPVEWTRKPERSHCTGTSPKVDTIRRWARGMFAECPICGRQVDIKINGELKKHQPPKTS